MEQLLAMPTDVVVYEVFPLLTWSDITSLDVALCSKALRPQLFDMYPMIRRRHSSAGIKEEELQWCIDRKIAMLIIHFDIKVVDPALLLLASAADMCASLTDLDVSLCRHITDIGAIAVAQQCRSLKRLRMGSTFLRNVSLNAFASSCPGLQTVSVPNCRDITDESIQNLAQLCPDLSRLILRGCSNLSYLSLEALAEHSSVLSELNLANCRLTCPGMIALCKHSASLTALDLCYSLTSVSHEALMHLGQLKLSKLIMSCSRKGGSAINDAVIHTIACGSNECLSELRIGACGSITDSAVESIAEHCPCLDTLELSDCAISDTAVVALADGCKSLTTLDLSSTLISDMSVEILTHCFPLLQSVDLSDCDISSGSIEAMRAALEWRLEKMFGGFLMAWRVVSDTPSSTNS